MSVIKNNSIHELFKEKDQLISSAGDLDCLEHQMPKKYWNSELKNFFCEHDEGASNNSVHFKFILDRYGEDVKKLKTLSNSKSINNSDELVNIFNTTNLNFENLFELCKKFKDDLEIFGNSFLKSFYDITEQDNEIYRLKDLIDSIKFDSSGRADYVGIGANVEREKNYLKLAKILISRNLTDSDLSGKIELTNHLFGFFNEYQKFLFNLQKQSDLIFSFLHQDLFKVLFRMEGKTNVNAYSHIICPIILREELTKYKESLNNQINLNNNLKIENQKLAYDMDTQNKSFLDLKAGYELIKGELKNKIQDFDKTQYGYENEIQEQKKSVETYLSQIMSLKNSNNSLLIKDDNNIKIIYQLKQEIESLREREKDQLINASSQTDEIAKLKSLYENKLQELELKNQSSLNTIYSLNSDIQNLSSKIENQTLKLEKYKERENEKLILASNKAEELIRLKSSYEAMIQDLENKIIKLEKSLVDQKSEWELVLKQKIENYQSIILKYEEEKNDYEDEIRRGEDLRLQLESLIKQNEILNSRIEELEKLLNITKEKYDHAFNLLSQYNEYKAQYDDIFIQKALLDKQMLEKNNKIMQLNIQIENLNLKNEGINNQLITLRQQYNSNENLHNKISLLTSQLEEANDLKTRFELENNELKNNFMKIHLELTQVNFKKEEYYAKMQKYQDEVHQLRNYENTIELLQNSKMEIDKLKTKLEKDKYNIPIISSGAPKLYNSLLVGPSPIDFKNVSKLGEQNKNNFNINSKKTEKINEKFSFTNSESQEKTLVYPPNSYISSNHYENRSLLGVADSVISYLSKTMLLSQNNWNVINDWISSMNISNGKKLNLNLLMKASRDGYSADIFKKKCHKKPSTLVVILTSYDKLIGGYTPLMWNSDDYTYVADNSKKTFLFSLTNQKKYNIKNSNYAICNGNDIGPIFGGGSDLEVVSNCHRNLNNFSAVGHSFEYDDTEENFYGGKKYYVKDYEVYEVKY